MLGNLGPEKTRSSEKTPSNSFWRLSHSLQWETDARIGSHRPVMLIFIYFLQIHNKLENIEQANTAYLS